MRTMTELLHRFIGNQDPEWSGLLPSLSAPPPIPPENKDKGRTKTKNKASQRSKLTPPGLPRNPSSGTIGRSISPGRAALPFNIGTASSAWNPLTEPIEDAELSGSLRDIPRTPEQAVLPTLPTSPFSPDTEDGNSERARRGSTGRRATRAVNGAASGEEVILASRAREGCCVVV